MSDLPFDTPGQVLREERKKQNISLKEISRKLKINLKYLSAIEDDDYALLPAELFAKSYLRTYADMLGLDSDEIINLYEARNISDENQEVPSRSGEEYFQKLKNYISSRLSHKPTLVIIAVAVVVVLISLMISSREQTPEIKTVPDTEMTGVTEGINNNINRDSTDDAADKIVETETESIAERPQKPEAKEAKDEETIVEQTVSREPDITAQTEEHVAKKTATVEKKIAGPMSLVISATELTWVSVSIDGAKAEEKVLRSGQSVTVSGRHSFAIKVGNAGGTRMVLDGRDLGALGPSGTVVDIVLP